MQIKSFCKNCKKRTPHSYVTNSITDGRVSAEKKCMVCNKQTDISYTLSQWKELCLVCG